MKPVVKTLLVAVPLVAAGAYLMARRTALEPSIGTQPVTKGDVIELVQATGTVQPTRTVDVGTLVSGIVTHLHADFNDVVRKGDVLAELDPTPFKSALDSATAAMEKAQIDVSSADETLAQDTRELNREVALQAGGLASQQELDDAKVLVAQDRAQVLDGRNAITVARAAVTEARLNLEHCTIASPIDGVVISRNVDEGQTVASSVAASSMFTLAADLTGLDVIGNIDEADITKVRPSDAVTFTVGSYPRSTFRGTVSEVRLNPTVTTDIVIYQAVIRAENPDLRLRPGMTTQLRVETSETHDVLRIPNAALKFKPTAAAFAALHEPLPDGSRIAPSTAPVSGRAANDAPPPAAGNDHAASGTIVDRLFAPAAPADAPAQVWVFDHAQLRRVLVRLGPTDGTWTAVRGGDLTPGEPLVTSMQMPAPR